MEHVRERIAIAATAMVLAFGVSAADKTASERIVRITTFIIQTC